nr:MAG TPA: hypothetical protein [Bacteriophage sp.]
MQIHKLQPSLVSRHLHPTVFLPNSPLIRLHQIVKKLRLNPKSRKILCQF